MKIKNTKEIDAILWLTANMLPNKIYPIKTKDQQNILQDIFCLSGIGLPTEQNEMWEYWFAIAEDWSTIEKRTNNEYKLPTL